MKKEFFIHTSDTDTFGLFSDSRNTDRVLMLLGVGVVVVATAIVLYFT